MSRIERHNTKTSNSGKKINSFWQNGKKEPFFLAHPLSVTIRLNDPTLELFAVCI